MSSERDVTCVDRVSIKVNSDRVLEKRPFKQITLRHLGICVKGKLARAEQKQQEVPSLHP